VTFKISAFSYDDVQNRVQVTLSNDVAFINCNFLLKAHEHEAVDALKKRALAELPKLVEGALKDTLHLPKPGHDS
jgi:hypothetical protein